jgi:hypothetical protein
MNKTIAAFDDWCQSINENQIEVWRSEYENSGVVVFKDFGSQAVFQQVHQEATYLIETRSDKRDMEMHITGGTPRRYYSVGRNVIKENNGLIPKLLHSSGISRLFASVVGKNVFPVNYAPEQYIINQQYDVGDTHGWHCDDYTWAFIWIMDATNPIDGGWVEYIPNVSFNYSNPIVSLTEILENRLAYSKWMPSGSAYLMHANNTLHRVTQLTKKQKHTVVVMTFGSADDYNKDINHGTMELLYPRDCGL